MTDATCRGAGSKDQLYGKALGFSRLSLQSVGGAEPRLNFRSGAEPRLQGRRQLDGVVCSEWMDKNQALRGAPDRLIPLDNAVLAREIELKGFPPTVPQVTRQAPFAPLSVQRRG